MQCCVVCVLVVANGASSVCIAACAAATRRACVRTCRAWGCGPDQCVMCCCGSLTLCTHARSMVGMRAAEHFRRTRFRVPEAGMRGGARVCVGGRGRGGGRGHKQRAAVCL